MKIWYTGTFPDVLAFDILKAIVLTAMVYVLVYAAVKGRRIR